MFRLAFFSLLWLPIFMASAQDYQVELHFEKKSFQSDEAINLTFKTDKPLPDRSWIGIFKKQIAHGSHSNYETYQYVQPVLQADLNFKAPSKAGDYEFRVFATEYGKEVKAESFKVVKVDPASIEIKLDAREYKEGGTLKVTVNTKKPANSDAWIGIFDEKTPRSSHSGYKDYKYIRSGPSFEFKVPEQAGNYEIRYYTADPGEFVKAASFRVGGLDLGKVAIQLNKEAFNPEENIEVAFTAHPDLPQNAWVGLFKADAAEGSHSGYLEYQYLRKKTSGKMYFKAPATKGNYQVRMFFSDYGRQLKSAPFQVKYSLDQNYLEKEIASKGRVRLYGIYFDTDKSVVKPESFPLLKEIAGLLNSEKSLKILIEGHTDNQGEAAYNQSLSEQRAKAVKEILISKYSVLTSQLEVKGFGETQPVGDNKTSIGRAANRRVELVKL
ncbi:OmpA family protein [Fulvivirgaceae bacterium BMA12]|uniref:OmpA family protein n=1 Tax=Agaribacillus aureus TaxID=3051825 RepID=A0ABT8L4Z4_9BACT|nr:OmpA family protein [Fulvivirgaceae bacterium BMA12]